MSVISFLKELPHVYVGVVLFFFVSLMATFTVDPEMRSVWGELVKALGYGLLGGLALNRFATSTPPAIGPNRVVNVEQQGEK